MQKHATIGKGEFNPVMLRPPHLVRRPNPGLWNGVFRAPPPESLDGFNAHESSLIVAEEESDAPVLLLQNGSSKAHRTVQSGMNEGA